MWIVTCSILPIMPLLFFDSYENSILYALREIGLVLSPIVTYYKMLRMVMEISEMLHLKRHIFYSLIIFLWSKVSGLFITRTSNNFEQKNKTKNKALLKKHIYIEIMTRENFMKEKTEIQFHKCIMMYANKTYFFKQLGQFNLFVTVIEV